MRSSKIRLILQILGFMALIMLSIYHRDMLQGKRGLAVLQQQQEQRKQLIREMCSNRDTFPDKLIFDNMTKKELKHLIVDDKHGIIYCYIPKVACTNWKRVMFVLNQTESHQDPMNVSGDLVHVPNTFKLLNSFPLPEMKARLKHYTKFLFVRDPFVRLISAYRDKFQRKNEYFYLHFARDMLRKYRNQPNPPKSVDEAFASDLRPSFNNFIQYLLDPRTEEKEPFEPHWRQMHRLCHTCLIEYDFVGHQESLQEDAEHLLRILKLQDVIKFPPSYDNMTSATWVSDWFRAVPLEARRKLYKLYEMDFKLFGYGKPSTLLND
ncbi:carbohydrate sulfotransferase 12-like [Myripristis murdjan]|uniref:carbohydrate sulfotransferase 12-like n=1 Tax=Myripristis murdjan TaxID=586833 RepID=UPI001176353F|nr:carbohydrate sulfotransferase 12-like [Myripristis murdjan]